MYHCISLRPITDASLGSSDRGLPQTTTPGGGEGASPAAIPPPAVSKLCYQCVCQRACLQRPLSLFVRACVRCSVYACVCERVLVKQKGKDGGREASRGKERARALATESLISQSELRTIFAASQCTGLA